MAGTEIQKRTPAPIETLAKFLTARRDVIAKIAVSGMDPDRIIKIALACCAKTPALLKCSPDSVYRAIHQSVQLGLEPGGALQHSYLVPYGGDCTLVIGYKGLVALARRSGEIATIEARVVRKHDKFDVDYGTDPKVIHKPFLGADAGEWVAAYCVITYRSGEKQFDVMSRGEVLAIKARSPASRSGPWVTDEAEMAKKTVVKRAMKMAPLTVELEEAMRSEDERDAGGTTLTVVADEAPPHDPVTGEVLDETPALPEAVQVPVGTSRAETEKAALRAQREAPAEKRATVTSDAGFLAEIAAATTTAALTKVGNDIEACRRDLGAAHAGVLAAWQAKFAAIHKAGA